MVGVYISKISKIWVADHCFECKGISKEKLRIHNRISVKYELVAEWSKAVDLSPTVSGCVGSNPA